MTEEESANTSRSETWLPAQSGMATSIRWPDENGPWLITAHWAKVGDRAMIVGLDLRSFTAFDLGDETIAWLPLADDLAEVTQRVLRGIPIREIRDRSREQLLADGVYPSLHMRSAPLKPDGSAPDNTDFPAHWMKPADVAAIDERAAETWSMVTAKGEPRKRRSAAGEELLRKVARLYEQAIGLGHKMPAKYVEEKLREAGERQLSPKGSRVQVRQWIRRARERGYLTIQPPRGA